MNKPIKVLIPVEFYQPIGGIERFVTNLTNAFSDDIEAVWAVEEIGGKHEVAYPKNAKIILLKRPRLEICKVIRNESPDIVFINNTMFFNLIGLFYARFRKIPVVYFCHQIPIYLDMDFINSMLWHLRRIYFRFASAVLVPSLAVKDEFAKRHFAKVPIPVYPGVDLEQFHPVTSVEKLALRKRYNLDTEVKVICWTSRFSFEKKPLLFIEAAKNDPGNTYLLVGFEPSTKLKLGSLVEKAEKPSNLVVMTNIGPGKIQEIYQLSDIYVNTSIYETFGSTVAEAAACGITTVVSNHGGTAESGKEGYLYEFNQTELENSIQQALKTPKTAKHIVSNRDNAIELEKIFAELVN